MSDRKIIDDYWENPETISLLDKNLRKLETDFVSSQLCINDELADFGCGDAESTVHYASKVRSCFALEYSQRLREIAANRFSNAGLQNVTLVAGDVMDLSNYHGKFNVAVTQRVVINFMNWEEQKTVIKNIWNTIRPGGRYIMVENTFEGFEAVNSVRRSVGLANLPLHDWHNYFLHYDKFREFIDGMFVIEKTHTFDLYYLLTRIYVNMFANFEGYGTKAIKDDIFQIADAAACKLYESIGNKVKITVDSGDSFGPIQGFVLRRMG